MPPPPPVTRALLIALLVVFGLQQIDALNLTTWLALWPVQDPRFWPWQLITYAFCHANGSHLFFNMLGLWMFGVELELLWGSRRFIQFLVASALAAGVIFAFFSLLFGSYVPIVGASGAIFGLLLAFGVLFPRRQILLFFVYQTDMRTAVFIFGALQVVLVLWNGGMNMSFLSNICHLGGMLGGWLMILWWRHRPPSFKRKSSPIRRVK